MIAQDRREPVIWNAAAEMVHVMDTHICGEPPQDDRQMVMRASVQGGLLLLPIGIALPASVLELMLDVEQPHAGSRREQRRRNLDENERVQSDQPRGRNQQRCNSRSE